MSLWRGYRASNCTERINWQLWCWGHRRSIIYNLEDLDGLIVSFPFGSLHQWETRTNKFSLTRQEKENTSSMWIAKYSFPHAIKAIDCTHVKIRIQAIAYVAPFLRRIFYFALFYHETNSKLLCIVSTRGIGSAPFKWGNWECPI